MRKLLLGLTAALGFTGCATEPDQGTEPAQPIDTIWAASIHPGDMFVLVPGTGSYDYIASVIDPMPAEVPIVDPRTNKTIGGDSIVFEQAIASAHRAGLPDSALEDGTLQFGLWGAGFTGTHTQFIYVSYEGLRVPIAILGGANTCAHGSVSANLLAYNATSALADATDLYQRIQAWLPAHPSVTGRARHLILNSHSWGGADAEYLTLELATIAAANGPLTDGGGVATIPLTIAMGVPGFVVGYTFQGPSLKYLDPVVKNALYEVDRPDDPVHSLQLQNNSDGHQYTILFGSDFQGSYGVTTEAMSCGGVPGACINP